jgi:hypothetical protein
VVRDSGGQFCRKALEQLSLAIPQGILIEGSRAATLQGGVQCWWHLGDCRGGCNDGNVEGAVRKH